jgi:hypothetical protein
MGTHDTTAAPAVAGVIDLDGTEYGAPGSDAPAGSLRGFRASSAGRPAPTDVAAVDDDKHAHAGLHSRTGSADPRRDRTTVLSDDRMGPMVERYDNSRNEVVIAHEAPPERPRQGFTGADPARAAQYVRPVMIRPFDKAIAEHPGAVLKVEQAGPLAARPKELADLSGGQPFAGGSTGTQREGIGPRPNSFRIMPKAWDALLVNTGGPAATDTNPDPAATAAAAQASRSWRA